MFYRKKIRELEERIEALEMCLTGQCVTNIVTDEDGTELYTYTRSLVYAPGGIGAYYFNVSGKNIDNKPSIIDDYIVCTGSTWFTYDGKFFMFTGTEWKEL